MIISEKATLADLMKDFNDIEVKKFQRDLIANGIFIHLGKWRNLKIWQMYSKQ